tara:strand:- start:257 stop:1396 length:1140 start_codon:yes stop_codon:yes gene_type:complete
MAEFKLDASSSQSSARAGTISINNKKIKTPVFMPVGTYGAVKTLSPNEISSIGYELILANTYHIYLRPGMDILKESKGLHNLMGWDGLILTDSGGFQIYSLKGLRKIQSDGAKFQSHLDGSMHKLTPENIIDIQRVIGSDIMMMLDVCPAGDETLKKWEEAVDLTSQWAKQAMLYLKNTEGIYDKEQLLVPIIQGGTNKNLREKSANELLSLDAFMYAIGGLAVGEPKASMLETVDLMNQLLPKDKPRYLMGVGNPIDLIKNVSNGVDMFDCVMPTRNARNGQLFLKKGKMNIRNSKYSNDHTPIDDSSKSPMSKQFTKSYLHHLFKTKEILGLRIATEHNLYFYYELMETMRKEIIADNFVKWSKKFISQYNEGDNNG